MTTTDRTAPTTTPTHRLLRTRGLWLFILITLAFPALASITAVETYVWIHSGETGIRLTSWGTVSSADERWPGVKHDDAVMAVNGVRAADPIHAIRMLQRQRPGPIIVGFAYGGHEWEIAGVAAPRDTVDKVVIALRGVAGALLFLVGILAFALRPGARVSWLFLLFCGALGAFLMGVVAFSTFGPYYRRFQETAAVLAAGFGLHLFATFPRPLSFVTAHRTRTAALYVPGLLAGIIFLGLYPRPELRPVWEIAASFINIWLAVAALLCLILLLLQRREARRNDDLDALAQYHAVTVGVILGLVVPAGWNLLRVSFGVGSGEWQMHLNAVPVTLFAVMTGYAVVRHNALAVDRFTATVVGYSVTIALLGLASATVIIGLPVLVGRAAAFQSPWAVAATTAVAIFCFMPIHRWLRRRIDHWFAREEASIGRAALVLTELVRILRGARPTECYAAAIGALASLRVERTEVWLLDDRAEQFVRVAIDGAPLATAPLAHDRQGALGDALRAEPHGGGLVDLAPLVMPETAQTELWAHGLALAVPIPIHGLVAGFLGVGRKRSGAAFTSEEQTFIVAVASQVGIALERASGEPTKLGATWLRERLGSGGMAEVFLAWQQGPGAFERAVAVKRLLPHLANDPDAVAAFLDEARIAAHLRHRNVAQIHEVGQQDGTFFIVMEYVDGPTLARLLLDARATGAGMPVPIAVGIASAVLAGLAYAHRAADARGRPLGIVHRDVTPNNVMLTRDGEPKLVDFGIARAADRLHVTLDGEVKGTLPYMAPEQALGKTVDARADLYALAAVLYETLTGQRAFAKGPSPTPPSPVSRWRRDVPATLQQILNRSFALDPEERFADAEQMREALNVAVGGSQIATDVQIATWMREVESAAASLAEDVDDPTQPDSGAAPAARRAAEALFAAADDDPSDLETMPTTPDVAAAKPAADDSPLDLETMPTTRDRAAAAARPAADDSPLDLETMPTTRDLGVPPSGASAPEQLPTNEATPAARPSNLAKRRATQPSRRTPDVEPLAPEPTPAARPRAASKRLHPDDGPTEPIDEQGTVEETSPLLADEETDAEAPAKKR